MKRIFIAVDISDEARQMAASYIDALRRAFPKLRVGWERPEKLHLTVKFLGDVNDKELIEVRRSVENIAAAGFAFSVSLGGTGVFPPKGDPRILWLGAVDNGHLAPIASALNDEFARLGFERERRKFSPHLTIARLRDPRASTELAAKHRAGVFGPVSFEVREIVLYESKLLPAGAVYTGLAKCPLKLG